MSNQNMRSGDFRRLGPLTITEEQVPSNVTIGEPLMVSEGSLPNQFRARTDTLGPMPKRAVDFQNLLDSRVHRDQEAWDTLWQALDPKLRAKVQETARDLAEAEQALTGARAQLADLDSRQPSKAADVPKWAQKRGEVAGMISAFEAMTYRARQAYEQAAQTTLTTAQGLVGKQWKQAETAHEEAVREYQRRKDAARAYLAEQNEATDAIRRLYQKVNSGDVDLFR
jgi:hypothetical protein